MISESKFKAMIYLASLHKEYWQLSAMINPYEDLGDNTPVPMTKDVEDTYDAYLNALNEALDKCNDFRNELNEQLKDMS